MKLDKFLKELFEQECIKGYEIGRLEVYVGWDGDMRCPEDACAKIVIAPKEKENAK